MHPLVAVSACITAVLCGTVIVSGGAAAQDRPRPAAERVKGMMGYFVRDEGAWVQMNEDFKPGSGEPRLWLKRFAFEMMGDLAIDRTFALYEGDVCWPLATIIHSAEADTGRLRSVGFIENGRMLTGSLQNAEDGKLERTAEGEVAPNVNVKLRELNDISDDAVFKTDAYRTDDNGNWVYRDSASWTFDSAMTACR